MNQADFIASWKREEELAHIKGWDFSHINDRYQEDETLPWDMGDIIREYLHPMMKLLDMETGGGEFLLSFHHPHENTAAIEGYPPNVAYCKEKLLPLGIDFREADGEGELPFEDVSVTLLWLDLAKNRQLRQCASQVKSIPGQVLGDGQADQVRVL